MMKTLCVVVVAALGLTSVCQAAPLACTRLLEPVAEAPSITGTWYFVAFSMPTCWTAGILGGIFDGIAVDIVALNTPNLYDANMKIKIGPHCMTESEKLIYTNKTIFDVDENNAVTGHPEGLLQTGCPDCLVLKDADDDETLMLLSRRKQVSSEEMMEFGKQSQCLGWSTPYVLRHNHEYTNCKPADDFEEDDFEAMGETLYEIVKNIKGGLSKCLMETLAGMW